MEFFYILPLILIFVAGSVGIRRLLRGYYRIKSLRELALSLKLQFQSAKIRYFDHEYLNFDFLAKGSNRYACNVMSGELHEYEIKGFDYHYEIELDDQDTTLKFDFSATLITSRFELKPMTIRPEAMFDKMAASFGWDDINFESAEFSRKFHVKAADRRWAYDVLSPRTIAYLLESPQYEIQMNQQHIAVRGKKLFEPQDFEKAFEIGATLLNGIPGFAKT